MPTIKVLAHKGSTAAFEVTANTRLEAEEVIAAKLREEIIWTDDPEGSTWTLSGTTSSGDHGGGFHRLTLQAVLFRSRTSPKRPPMWRESNEHSRSLQDRSAKVISPRTRNHQVS
jgi:hypothetical protein